MLTTQFFSRTSRTYTLALSLIVVSSLAFVAVAAHAHWGSSPDGRLAATDVSTTIGQASAVGAGFAASGPGSLSDLQGSARVIVEGTIERRIGSRDVVITTSRPLGPEAREIEIAIPVVSYELRVTRYILGTGNEVLTFEQPGGSAATPLLEGTVGLYFLSPATAWRGGGYSSHYGARGVLTVTDGEITYADVSKERVPFLSGRTIEDVVAELSGKE